MSQTALADEKIDAAINAFLTSPDEPPCAASAQGAKFPGHYSSAGRDNYRKAMRRALNAWVSAE
jgi:hypothetical protein